MGKVTNAPKPKTLEELTKRINEKYGKGTVVGGREKERDFEVVSTGSILYDRATDCGGDPIGKLIEIFGPESSGKSTLVMHKIAEFQKKGYPCALFDHEHSFDSEYARRIGINIDELLISQEGTMEQSYNIIYDFVTSGMIRLVVLDSHTSMIPAVRLEGEIGDAKVAPEARVNSDALKKIHPMLSRNKCTLVGVSQLRADIGGMSAGAKPTGGNAWKFYTDMRVKVYKEVDKNKERNNTVIEIVKNKCGKPFGKCTVPIAWGIGIDKMEELISVAVASNIIQKGGSWYSYGDLKLGQGIDSVKNILIDNEGLKKEISNRVNDEDVSHMIEQLNPEEVNED